MGRFSSGKALIEVASVPARTFWSHWSACRVGNCPAWGPGASLRPEGCAPFVLLLRQFSPVCPSLKQFISACRVWFEPWRFLKSTKKRWCFYNFKFSFSISSSHTTSKWHILGFSLCPLQTWRRFCLSFSSFLENRTSALLKLSRGVKERSVSIIIWPC